MQPRHHTWYTTWPNQIEIRTAKTTDAFFAPTKQVIKLISDLKDALLRDSNLKAGRTSIAVRSNVPINEYEYLPYTGVCMIILK